MTEEADIERVWHERHTFKGGGECGELLFRKPNMHTKQFKKTPYPTSINHDIPNITGNLSKKTKSFQIV